MNADFSLWDHIESLNKTVYAQGRRVEELEARLADLETRLAVKPATEKEKEVERTKRAVAAIRAGD
jgi:hypothetical protein